MKVNGFKGLIGETWYRDKNKEKYRERCKYNNLRTIVLENKKKFADEIIVFGGLPFDEK